METLQRNNLWKLYSAIIYGNSTARLVVLQGERVTRRSPKEHHVGISDLMRWLGLGAGVAVRGGERDGGSQGTGHPRRRVPDQQISVGGGDGVSN
jgi:hypothetical protein